MCKHTKQQGTAIIVALFITSLVAAASIMMLSRLAIDMRRTELLLNTTQANLYAQGSIAWAKEQLNNNFQHAQPNKITDATPIRSPVNTVEHATVTSVIYDAQGRFNINNLTNVTYFENFLLLIHTVAPKMEMTAARDIALGVQDWISPNSRNTLFTEYYAKLKVPYRAPHRPMVSISELRLIKGVTAELYAALLPYVTALPSVTLINVNSAPVPVLISLIPTLTLESAKAIELHRQQIPFISSQQFLDFDVVKNHSSSDLKNKITTVSSYFLVRTNVKVRDQELMLYTLLQRLGQPGTSIREIVLWQSKGTL